MLADPTVAALERRVAALENALKELQQSVKVTGSNLQVNSNGKLSIRASGPVEIVGPIVSVNNGALEVT